ncbi:DUF3124 domain-containing protein [Portibacter marinus]|uniref:DUF3124 domain-containing protein n=1 Tax=Portibacter marinus TaxID=2898660 RepID=UPI001F1E066E|nr:DUF3124 domain-containing protein [Portibacter marinus]
MQYYLFLAVAILVSCGIPNPNINTQGEDIIESHLAFTDKSVQDYRDTVYIPIYSDIYSESRLKSTLLTATLSIRSTSLKDTTYINNIDYYNTKGDLVKSFIDRTLVLEPMQSIDYVIDRDDNTGGVGANFIVTWGSSRNTQPLFQAVMIGRSGQHGLAFMTEGVSIKRK